MLSFSSSLFGAGLNPKAHPGLISQKPEIFSHRNDKISAFSPDPWDPRIEFNVPQSRIPVKFPRGTKQRRKRIFLSFADPFNDDFLA